MSSRVMKRFSEKIPISPCKMLSTHVSFVSLSSVRSVQPQFSSVQPSSCSVSNQSLNLIAQKGQTLENPEFIVVHLFLPLKKSFLTRNFLENGLLLCFCVLSLFPNKEHSRSERRLQTPTLTSQTVSQPGISSHLQRGAASTGPRTNGCR